jgi:hypothetical protein
LQSCYFFIDQGKAQCVTPKHPGTGQVIYYASVEKRFHHGTEDYICVRITRALNTDNLPTLTNEFNFDNINPSKLAGYIRRKQAQHIHSTVEGEFELDGGTTIIKSKENVMMTSRVSGNIKATKVMNTATWKVGDWYKYIMGDTTYDFVVPQQSVNDCARKILITPDVTRTSITDLVHAMTGSGRATMRVNDHIIPLVKHVLAGAVETELRITQLSNSFNTKILNDAKHNRLQECDLGIRENSSVHSHKKFDPGMRLFHKAQRSDHVSANIKYLVTCSNHHVVTMTV